MFPRRGKGQAVAETLYVEDVFSAFTYAGTGAAQNIVNGVDLLGKGGLAWIKCRSFATNHILFDTVRGDNVALFTSTTSAEQAGWAAGFEFNSDGFGVDLAGSETNTIGRTYVGWTFREAANFFKQQAKSHTNGVASTVDLSVLGTVGMVVVKQTNGTGDWWVWHRSLTAGNNLRLNTTAAQSTTNAHLSVSGTTLTIASGMATGTYIVYAWAHDTASDGIIQCGTFTTDASGNATVNLGWEAQYINFKQMSSAGNWGVFDTARNWNLGANDGHLFPNTTGAENAANQRGNPTATGIAIADLGNTITYVYVAIRKGQMRTPTDATKVFDIIVRTGTGSAATISLSGIKTGPDLAIIKHRSAVRTHIWQDRLRGTASQLSSDSTGAEGTDVSMVTAFNMSGVTLGIKNEVNASGGTFINYFLKQARGYFDEVAYNGTGSAHTEAHNLGVVPELIFVKNRSAVLSWQVYFGSAADHLELNSTSAAFTNTGRWNNTPPTDSVFSLGTYAGVNGGTANIIAYLFASCPGVSKISTYAGTGAAQNIDCGFTAGARFVLIKRIDSTGDWYYWDSTRGIISGNDPYLLMNSTAAEVTSADYVEPYSAGFALDATAPAALNASGGTFLFLAIA